MSKTKGHRVYYNCKGFYSMVLLAVCDADHCFNNNSVALDNSTLIKKLEHKQLKLSPDEPSNGCKFSPLPYFVLGDEIFLLKNWLMKPYPGINSNEK